MQDFKKNPVTIPKFIIPLTLMNIKTELEKRIAELSNEMTKPEIARDITKLVAVNDEYERSKAQLALLLDEWERAETAATPSTKNAKRR